MCPAVEEIPPASPTGAPALAPLQAVPGDADVIRLPTTDPVLADNGGNRRLLQGPRGAGLSSFLSSCFRQFSRQRLQMCTAIFALLHKETLSHTQGTACVCPEGSCSDCREECVAPWIADWMLSLL